jgi:hypothetical protein
MRSYIKQNFKNNSDDLFESTGLLGIETGIREKMLYQLIQQRFTYSFVHRIYMQLLTDLFYMRVCCFITDEKFIGYKFITQAVNQ